MQDYGKHYREQFLNEEKINKRHQRHAYWLLLITVMYVTIHIGLYLWRTYL
jgi:hypothetical protein